MTTVEYDLDTSGGLMEVCFISKQTKIINLFIKNIEKPSWLPPANMADIIYYTHCGKYIND
jgi:hypothetical protein